MTARSRLFAFVVLLVGAASLWSCSGGGESANFPTVISLGANQEVFPSVRNTSLGVGANRVIVGLTDKDNTPVTDASVHLRFYDLNGAKPHFEGETDTDSVLVDLSFDDAAAVTKTVTGQDGVYATTFRFERPGNWGVQVDVKRGGRKLKPIPFTFTVLDHTPEPAIGDMAPASRQITLHDQPDIEAIDSSVPPRPQMHDITVADALASARPLLIAFATPAFCESRTCGPIMDTVADPLFAAYHDSATFIQIEPYDLAQLRDTNRRDPVRAMREWNLQSEPWIFIVDRNGRVAAKFEGIASRAEVEVALQRVISGTPPPEPQASPALSPTP